jgi:hypothetical protein
MAEEENPYAPPRAPDHVVGVKSGRREDLRAVAVSQKAILGCILVYFLCIAVQIVLSQYREGAQYSFYIAIIALVVVLVGMVSVVRLAIRVYSVTSGIILGIGTLIPCIGLLILLMINGKATKILKENGHRVGFLGADLSKF